MTRAVIYINTFVSGIFWDGSPRAVYFAAGDRLYIPLMSEELIAELYDVASRDKFKDLRQRLGRTPDELIAEIRTVSEIVTPGEVPANIVRDSDDAAVLACAIGGNADYIVSGDKDLVVLKAYRSIPILNANQFLPELSKRQA